MWLRDSCGSSLIYIQVGPIDFSVLPRILVYPAQPPRDIKYIFVYTNININMILVNFNKMLTDFRILLTTLSRHTRGV